MSPHSQRPTSSGVTRGYSRLSSTSGGARSPLPSARCLSSGCTPSVGGCPPLSELPELLVEEAAAEVAAAAAAAGTLGSLAAFRRSTFRRRSTAAGTSSGGGGSGLGSRGGSRRNSSRRIIPLPPFIDGLSEHTAAQRQQVLYEVASPFSSYAAAAAVDESDDESAGAEGAASPTPFSQDVDVAAVVNEAAGVARRLQMGSRRWLLGASSGAISSFSRAPSAASLAGMNLTSLSRTTSAADLVAAAAPVFAAYSCVDSELVGTEEQRAEATQATAATAAAQFGAGAGAVGGGFLEGDEACCASPYYGSEAEEDEQEAYGWLYSSEDEDEAWSRRTSRAAAAGGKKGAGDSKANRSSSGGGGGRSGWFGRWLSAMGVGGMPRASAHVSGGPNAASPSPPPSDTLAFEPAAMSGEGRAACVAAPMPAAADAGAVAFVEMLPCHGVSQLQGTLRPPNGSRAGQQPQQAAAECAAAAAEGVEAAEVGQLENDASRSLARSRFSWRR